MVELGYRLLGLGYGFLLFSAFVWCWRIKMRIDRRRARWGKI